MANLAKAPSNEPVRTKFGTLTRNISSVVDKASSWAGSLSGFLALAVTLLITCDVVSRYFFNFIIPGTLEISRLVLAWICFMGVTCALTGESHVRMTLLLKKFGPRGRAIMECVICLVSLMLFLPLAWKSSSFFWNSWINGEWFPAPIKIPYWLAKLSMPAGAWLFSVALVARLLYNINQFFSGVEKD